MGKAERTEQFIIEKAAPIFNSKGISGTTIDDILSATKLAKGGLYRRFENKNAITTASVDYLFEKLTNEALAINLREKTATSKILAFFELYRNPLTPFIEGGCPMLNFGVDTDDTDPLIKGKVKRMIELTIGLFADILRQGIANGELSDQLDSENFSLKMLIMLEGAMMVSRVLGSNKPMHQIVSMLQAELNGFDLNNKTTSQ
jgi:AcrR family transcriptional regulator